MAEQKAIETPFPELLDPHTVHPMAAWFYLLAAIDDVIEAMRHVVAVLEAMAAEVQVKYRRESDAREYFNIRILTICLKPFIHLLQLDLRHEQDFSVALELLQRQVSIIVGIRNNLI